MPQPLTFEFSTSQIKYKRLLIYYVVREINYFLPDWTWTFSLVTFLSFNFEVLLHPGALHLSSLSLLPAPDTHRPAHVYGSSFLSTHYCLPNCVKYVRPWTDSWSLTVLQTCLRDLILLTFSLITFIRLIEEKTQTVQWHSLIKAHDYLM